MIDSKPATYAHINVVQQFMELFIKELIHRSTIHDQSKLVSPEVEIFDEFTPKLAHSTYLSPEYKQFMQAMKPALDHHYSVNSHHPEHYSDGIKGMNLLDLIEMMADWKAAGQRHKNPNSLETSIEKNQARFGYSDELKSIFINTAKLLDKLQ